MIQITAVQRKDASITSTGSDSDFPGTFEVILSSPSLDRDGETLSPDEWKLPLPAKIPFDVDHGMSVQTTVGSGVPRIDPETGNLVVSGTWSSLPRAQEVRTLVNEGHIDSTSVAFMTTRRQKSADGKTVVQRELLNGAFVAIPANPDARILSAKSSSGASMPTSAELIAKANQIAEDPRLSNSEKTKKLAELRNELEAANVKSQARRLIDGASALPAGTETKSIDPSKPARGLAVPASSANMSLDVMKEAYARIKSGANFRAELGLKDTNASNNTESQLLPQFGGLVPKVHEPTRILDLLATTTMASPQIEFVRHESTSIAANQIAAPTLTKGTASSGGSFAAGTVYWVATYVTPTGETTASAEVSATLTANQEQPLSVGAFPSGVVGWNLYRGLSAGGENVRVNGSTPITSLTFTDTGASAPSATAPTANTTGMAGTISAGTTYPEAVLNTSTQVATAQKIGIFTTLTDELTADFEVFRNYLSVDLNRLIVDAENAQLLNGNGTSPQLLGLLKTPGTLSRAKGGESNIDLLEEAMTDLRNGQAFCDADVIILNRNDWSLIRRTKDSYGRYLLGDPGQVEVNSLWGVRVATTSQMPAGTAIVANTGLLGAAYVREGVTLEMTNAGITTGGQGLFQNGLVMVRAHERLALAVERPAAINVVTGIA